MCIIDRDPICRRIIIIFETNQAEELPIILRRRSSDWSFVAELLDLDDVTIFIITQLMNSITMES